MDISVIKTKLNYAYDHFYSIVLGTLDDLEDEILELNDSDGEPDIGLHKKFDELMGTITSAKEELFEIVCDINERN